MNLSPDQISDIVMVSNFTMVASEVLMVAYLAKWKYTAHGVTNKVLMAWLLVSVGYMIRIGFWAVGVYVGGTGRHYKCDLNMLNCVIKVDPYPSWALDNRGWLAIAALMVTWGTIMFIRHIEGFGLKTKISLFLLILFSASAPLVIR